MINEWKFQKKENFVESKQENNEHLFFHKNVTITEFGNLVCKSFLDEEASPKGSPEFIGEHFLSTKSLEIFEGEDLEIELNLPKDPIFTDFFVHKNLKSNSVELNVFKIEEHLFLNKVAKKALISKVSLKEKIDNKLVWKVDGNTLQYSGSYQFSLSGISEKVRKLYINVIPKCEKKEENPSCAILFLESECNLKFSSESWSLNELSKYQPTSFATIFLRNNDISYYFSTKNNLTMHLENSVIPFKLFPHSVEKVCSSPLNKSKKKKKLFSFSFSFSKF